MPEHRRTPPLMTIADRYEATELIGRGGAGSVYRAWDLELERWVAVKVLPVEVGEAAAARRRSEARLLASVNHPGLVTLFDALTDDDATHLVMELLDGGTWRDRTGAGPVSEHEVAVVGAQIARGLAHIHANGIVHRDVKPANILLAATPPGADPVAKLSDFGIARLLETSPTGTTGVLGTARYVSPEQATGAVVGSPSDVYSFGLTLLEALTGEPAFPGEPAVSLTARLVRDPVVPAALPPGWRSLLTAMLARRPEDRLEAQQVEQWIFALADATSGDEEVTRPLPVAAPDQPTLRYAASAAPLPVARRTPRRRRRIAVVAVPAALLLGAGLLVPAVLDPAGTRAGGASAPPRPTAAVVARASATPAASAIPSASASASRSSGSGSAQEVTVRTTSAPPASTSAGNGKSSGNGKSAGNGKGPSKSKPGADQGKGGQGKDKGKGKP